MARFFAQALKAVERVPGVAAAAFTSQLPLSGDSDGYGVQFEKESAQRRTRAAFRYAVTPDYFTAMQIPLRRGRLLNHRDAAGSPLAVVINESLARSVFGDADPLGQRLRAGPSVDNAKLPWSVIVGVVGDVKQASLAVTGEDAFYVSSAQWYWTDNSMALVVRTPGEAAALAGPVRAAVWSVDKEQPILRVATMRALLTRSQAQRRFALIWLEAFALLALVLAASGIYGLLSGSVTERMRELGVRAALGASRGNNLALVLRQGMALTLAGVLIGLAGAIAASQALVSLLFGVSQLDPMTYLGVIAMVYGVAALACWLPARRAAKVEPSLVLRAE
jgi:putative ABC transport system permease protein